MIKRSIPSVITLILLLLSTVIYSQELYLVFLNSNPDRLKLPECDENALQQAHLDNIEKLYDEGKLLLAGPFDGGGGVFVLKAASYKAAQGYLDTDPAIAADRFLVETFPLGIQKGMICAQEEPYEMIQFNFIEYFPLDGNEKSIPYVNQMDYAKKDEVLFSAAISYEDDRIGYIAILPLAEDAETYANNAPVIVKGTHTHKLRLWWSTDETFCTDENKKIN